MTPTVFVTQAVAMNGFAFILQKKKKEIAKFHHFFHHFQSEITADNIRGVQCKLILKHVKALFANVATLLTFLTSMCVHQRPPHPHPHPPQCCYNNSNNNAEQFHTTQWRDINAICLHNTTSADQLWLRFNVNFT